MKINSVRYIYPAFALVAVIVTAAYLPDVLKFGYVWDDFILFIYKSSLRIPEKVLQGVVSPVLDGTTYFRPLPLLTFSIEFLIHGVDARISHAVNLLIHTVNSILVGLFVYKLGRVRGISRLLNRAFIAGLTYGLHPALVEPVAWVSGRFDLLVTFFSLAALISYFTLSGTIRATVVCAFLLFSLLSKEMAVSLPLIIVVLGYAVVNQDWKGVRGYIKKIDNLYLWCGMILSVVFYFVIRFYFMGKMLHIDKNLSNKFLDVFHRIAYTGEAIQFYIKKVLWPFSSLSPQHPLVPSDLTLQDVIFGNIIVVLVVVFVLYSLRLRHFFMVLLACGLFSLIPVLHILPLTIGGNIGHERFLALSLVYFVAAVTLFEFQCRVNVTLAMSSFLRVAGALTICAWLVYSFLTVKLTAPLWQSDLTLWAWAHEKNSDSTYITMNYASAALRSNLPEVAKKILEKDINTKYDENEVISVVALRADVYLRSGDSQQAIKVIENYLQKHNLSFHARQKFTDPQEATLVYDMYLVLLRAYLSVFRYVDAAEVYDVMVSLKNPDSSALLFGSFARYGVDDWLGGEELFEKARYNYLRQSYGDVMDARVQFLETICARKPPPESVCNNWRNATK